MKRSGEVGIFRCKKTGHWMGERAKGKEELTAEDVKGMDLTGVRGGGEEQGVVVAKVSGARFRRILKARQRRQGVSMLLRLAQEGHLGGRLLSQPSKLPPPPGCRGRSRVGCSWGPGLAPRWGEPVSSSCRARPGWPVQPGPPVPLSTLLSSSAQLSSPALPRAQASANHFSRRRGGWGSGLLLSVLLPNAALPLGLAALQAELFPPSPSLPPSGPAQLALGSLPVRCFSSVLLKRTRGFLHASLF